MTGGETELDRAILESLTDPLTHLLRNAVSHGIEPPGDGERSGKPARGGVELRARCRGAAWSRSASSTTAGVLRPAPTGGATRRVADRSAGPPRGIPPPLK